MSRIPTAETLRNREFVLDAILRYTADEGWPPTVREVADEVGLSVSSVHGHLLALVRDGRIRRLPDSPRAIAIVPEEAK